MNAQMIMTKILTLPGIILGLSLHEFAHAWMSDRLGDPTPRRQGRLTINPMAHIDWVRFIALLFVGFGWGRPVMIDPGYYKNRRAGEFMTGIAGITMNLILAVILSFPAKAIMNVYYSTGSGLAENAFYIFYYAVFINICLMLFNLIPVPPLDGWGILTQLFNLERYSWWYKVYQYGQWILLLLIFANITDLILGPAVNAIMHLLVF
jgi:Zn-dependent protease